MQIPTNFIVSPRSQVGEVYGTEFTFTADLPAQYTKFVWDFGDNSKLFYNNSIASHTFKYPGLYTVQLSSWTEYGESYVDAATINVDYVYRDSVRFSSIPTTYGLPGLSSAQAFVVAITSAKIDQPISIVLQSFNSKSTPYYTVPSKWRSITPTWKFTDSSHKTLESSLVIPTTPIYNKDGKVVAVQGTQSFYYIDDLSTGINPETDCPLILMATLSTENFSYPPESIIYPYAGYSNAEVSRAVISWQINDIIPTDLLVTENFINDVHPVKWANVPIPVMITLQADTSKIAAYSDSIQSKTNVLSYPRTNELGRKNPVHLKLYSEDMPLIKGVHYRVDEEATGPLYFKATDKYNNIASGYIFTTITPLTALTGTIRISAETVTANRGDVSTAFSFPIGYPLYANAYVSHPAAGLFNKIDIAVQGAACPGIDAYRALGILSEGSISYVNVPTLTSSDLINYSLSGGGGIYGLSFNPIKNRLYAADMDLNTISCYYAGTALLTSIQLEDIMGNSSAGPSHISVDRDNNIWVSLFDDHKLLKFDQNLNYLLSAAPAVQDYVTIDNVHPPVVETDKDNNVWACYPNPGNSLLIKFSSEGIRLNGSELPVNSVPVCLSIDAENKIWVASKNTNNLMQFSSEGVYLSEITGLLRPSYIAQDLRGDLWILHGYNLCSKYTLDTSTLQTWRVNAANDPTNNEENTKARRTVFEPVAEYTDTDIYNAYYVDEIWGGLCTDVFDRVWIVDSVTNSVLTVSPLNVSICKVTKMIPRTTHTQYVIMPGDTFITNLSVDTVPSAQAGGDWTGNRWYQKYSGGYHSKAVSGVSAPFKVYDIDKSFKLAKVNESFNCAEYFKSLAFPEVLQNNSVLFDSFFAAIVGDGDPTKESAGRVMYERIANFVNNRRDFETAEIDALLSIAAEMAVDVDTFGTGFPVAVNRLLNIFSVHKQQLRGIPNLESDVSLNKGDQLTLSSIITANQLYYVEDNIYRKAQLVYASELFGKTTYPLSEFVTEDLPNAIQNYQFYTYNDKQINADNPWVGNLIDWDHDLTTLTYNVSSNEEWYGDGGLVEIMFNNLLTKQLYSQ